MPNVELIHADCMDVMKQYPDKHFELAICDPPYGINISYWDKEIPSGKYWEELFRVSINQIVWGGNYFNLPYQRGWVCWDKSMVKAGYLSKISFDEFELAWTSFDCKCRMIRFSDIGNMSGFNGKIKIDYQMDPKIHPTQKHTQLYAWLLKNYAKPGDKILDTHLGSGSSAIAAHKLGFDFTGIEIDKDYFDAAMKRFKKETAMPLFDNV